MELMALTNNFEPFNVIDSYESLIWVERYREPGDFEIYTGTIDKNVGLLENATYFALEGSKSIMVMEKIQFSEDLDEGSKLIISGRCLKSILARRIVWKQTILDGLLEDEIERLINENFISPDDPNRAIPGFTFRRSGDPYLESLTIMQQLDGDDILTAIEDICKTYGIGFEVGLTEEKTLYFSLVNGVDRSYDQYENPYVIFSPDFENLISSNYTEDYTNRKTVVLVAGEGDGYDRETTPVEMEGGSPSGINRMEMYSDSRNISSNVEEESLSYEEYEALLAQKGRELLAQNYTLKTFESKVDTTRMFQYGRDFFIGDIVQISTGASVHARARVLEFIRSNSVSGNEEYPTFESL